MPLQSHKTALGFSRLSATAEENAHHALDQCPSLQNRVSNSHLQDLTN